MKITYIYKCFKYYTLTFTKIYDKVLFTQYSDFHPDNQKYIYIILAEYSLAKHNFGNYNVPGPKTMYIVHYHSIHMLKLIMTNCALEDTSTAENIRMLQFKNNIKQVQEV